MEFQVVENPFLCDICLKAFSENGNLKYQNGIKFEIYFKKRFKTNLFKIL